MKLSKLFLSVGLKTKIKDDIEINHICCDSRAAHSNSVFVCIRGAVTDGHIYVRSAYNRGCRAFVAEHAIELPDDAVVVLTDAPRRILAALSDSLLEHPSGKLKIIGITGTKGKTTTALMISGILNKCGISTGYIGSNGVEYGFFRHRTANTTPESCDLQRYLYDMVNSGIKYVTLEVSSQALYLERVRYIDFDTCVFTNLSPDHIGGAEHPDFEHYKACKASLFSEYKPHLAIVNADDPYTPDIIASSDAAIDTFGITGKSHHMAKDIAMKRTDNSLGVTFNYLIDSDSYPVSINFPGTFSVQNALAAIAVCREIIPDTQRVVSALTDITVEGRFELVHALSYATVVIDYAHNGTSLREVLKALRLYNPARLICLFGSVGGRTQMRRPELGAAASELSDFCILTADNPDCEDPLTVIRDIAAAFLPGGCGYVSIPDRREAIEYAMKILKPGDILLLAGKGQEDYQLIRGSKVPFCERDIVMKAAKKLQESFV